MNPYPYSADNKRYYTWNYYLKQRFRQKVYKVPLSLAQTCPNRDGSKGFGGCTFCSGGGGGFPYYPGSVADQFEKARIPFAEKWPNAACIAYFQSYSNTYIAPNTLAMALEEALALPQVVGIALATRPDCLPAPILEILEEYHKRTFFVVELGLQTIHDTTAQLIGRGHCYNEFVQGYHALTKRKIPVCVHLLNGLPGESPAMMLKTAQTIALLNPHSVKLHMLHLIENTAIATDWQQRPFPLLSKDEYVEIVCNQLEVLPPTTVIQRITGDPPQEGLVAPIWTTNKLWVRNAIDKELAERNTYQGIYFRGCV